MHPRAALFAAVATAVALTALFAMGLADPAAAQTSRSYRTHTRALHRRHRVHVIRSGFVTASYVPLRRAALPPERSVPRVVRAMPAGPAATALPDEHTLWAAAREPGAAPPRGAHAPEVSTRIPEDRFAVLFGMERPFRLSILPARVTGSHVQFENSGYWFTLLDAVPRSWPDTWYDTDAISVVEHNGGYALVDLSHPSDPLSLRVTVED